MRITMIGTGYVGLVTGVCFAELGVDVTCVDRDEVKIGQLLKGRIPIYEPGLDAMVRRNVEVGRLGFTTDLAAAVASADVVFIAVGTPPRAEDGHADLRYVFAAAEQIGQAIEGYTVIVTKSTVPVGTGRKVAAILAKYAPETQWAIASNPEFLREGSAIEDFMAPDRIVVGVEAEQAASRLHQLYKPLTNKGVPLLETDIETAEMIKYASNSFLATKIAFINEMADICEKVGANVELVAKGMGMDARIGERFLRPGPGYGGSCFPKDAQALARLAEVNAIDPYILQAVISYNLARRHAMVEKVIAACGGSVKGKRIAILGLTFKANTDDMRESPSLIIVSELVEAGADIMAYDPEGMANARPLLPEAVAYAESIESATEAAEAAVIITEWDAFRAMDLKALARRLALPCIIDLRNLFMPEVAAAAGLDYYSVGRAPALGASECAHTYATPRAT